MEFDDTFTVQAPLEDVWSALLDVERVTPCMPGAQVLEQLGDDTYAIAVAVKVGPITMRYRGELQIVERDAGEHRAVMRARAREARGQGTAAATIETRLTSENGATAGTIHTDLQMSGRAAAMGRGVIQDVAARLTRTFSDNLAAMLTSEPEAKEAPAAGAEPAREEAAPTAGAGAGGAATGERVDGAPPPPSGDRQPTPEPLQAGGLAADVVATKLRDPLVLAAAGGGLALLFGLLGYLLGRSRG